MLSIILIIKFLQIDVTIRFNVEEVELKSSSNYTIYVYVTSVSNFSKQNNN